MLGAAQDCFGDVEELPVSEWDRVMRVNVTSCLLTAKYCVPLMRQRGGGSIINVSSVSGLANQRKAMVYSVSKAALISLTKSEGAPEPCLATSTQAAASSRVASLSALVSMHL